MNGGTYSEAIKVGFSSKEAGFLARLGGETRQEAVEEVLKILKKDKEKQKEALSQITFKFFYTIIILSIGVVAGIHSTHYTG